MKRSLWLSVTAFVLGAGLLVASGLAGASTGQVAAKKGGTMKMNMSGTDVDFTDPSLAYGTISWQIEYATALKLYNYPDKAAAARRAASSRRARLVSRSSPRTARRTPSPSRPGFKFSNGEPVTAANYAFAMNRALSPTMQSPAAPFMTTIVGAQAVIDGKAQKASAASPSRATRSTSS